jgi:diguanylate cyclase (GGDEF)-like protein/PAS domain S-box-containing protein
MVFAFFRPQSRQQDAVVPPGGTETAGPVFAIDPAVIAASAQPMALIGRARKIAASETGRALSCAVSNRATPAGALAGMAFLQGSAAGIVSVEAAGQKLLYDAAFLRVAHGGDAAILVTAREVTMERAALDALVKSRALHRDLIACSSDFAWSTDASGAFTFVNRAQILGLSDQALHGRRAGDLLAGPAGANPFSAREALDGADVRLKAADGTIVTLNVAAVPVYSPDGVYEGARGIARDVTALREAEAAVERARAADAAQREALLKAMEERASTDPLTGCLNRAAFAGHGAQTLDLLRKTRRPAAFLYLDVDRFKALNDTHGHGAGDEALAGLGRLLRGKLRSGDLAVRFGGDEFGLLLAGADEAGALSRAGRLLAEAAAPDAARPVALSIGIALFEPSGHESLDALVARADRALYQAKREGRGRASLWREEIAC